MPIQYIPGVLLSFDVYLDESAPHVHALILPLVNDKVNGNEIMDGKGNTSSRQTKERNRATGLNLAGN